MRTEYVTYCVQAVTAGGTVSVRPETAIQKTHHIWIHADMQRINRQYPLRAQSIIPRGNRIRLATQADDGSAWALRRSDTRIFDDPIPKRVGRHDRVNHLAFRAACAFVICEKEQAILLNRPAQGTTKNVPNQFGSTVALTVV